MSWHSGGNNVGKTALNSGDGERGPGWYDVSILLREIALKSGGRARLVYDAVTPSGYKWGIRVFVRMVGMHNPIGAASYGPVFTQGSKTMASAIYLALFRAHEWLDAAGIDYSGVEGPGHDTSVAS